LLVEEGVFQVVQHLHQVVEVLELLQLPDQLQQTLVVEEVLEDHLLEDLLLELVVQAS
jgi:hypothetical protein